MRFLILIVIAYNYYIIKIFYEKYIEPTRAPWCYFHIIIMEFGWIGIYNNYRI